MHSYTNFKLINSKFAQVKKFRENFRKIKNLKKFERSNRFWPNSIPKILDRCIIFICNFRTMAQILRKLELPKTFSKNSKSHKIRSRAHTHIHTYTHTYIRMSVKKILTLISRFFFTKMQNQLFNAFGINCMAKNCEKIT